MQSSTSAWGCLLAGPAQTLGRLLPFLFGSVFPKQEFRTTGLVTPSRPRQASHLRPAEAGPGAGRASAVGWAGLVEVTMSIH